MWLSEFVTDFEDWCIVKILFYAGHFAQEHSLSASLHFTFNQQVCPPHCALFKPLVEEILGIIIKSPY